MHEPDRGTRCQALTAVAQRCGESVHRELDAGAHVREGCALRAATDRADALDSAMRLAETITTKSAPLGVQATLRSATVAATQGDDAAIARLHPDIAALFGTADCAEGMASFVERREAQFTGR